MQNVIFSSIPLQEFQTVISDTIKMEMQKHFPVPPTTPQTEFLTRKEAAKLLAISLPTLLDWTNNGLIQGYRIASRVRYKTDEIVNALSKIETSKNKI
jgi:excisionase family DNA binding protein